jgi:N-methylhydantoinase A
VAVGAGFPNAVGFDLGGTSTDVCLIVDGQPEQRSLTTVGGLPCLAPAVAIHTVGAGGGSVAAYDPGGALRVGPQSAGAEPGPACYGRGGTAPTVTDANVVLGRVRALVGGAMTLDRDAAVRALGTLDDDVAAAAEAVVAVVEATMERALREVTVQRGVSPADLAIVAFGGAGGLHAASLCAALGARAVVVPPRAGVLSAVGLLAAPVRADRSRTVLSSLDQLEPALLEELADEAVKEIAWAGEPLVGYLVDCRYRGQSHELTVPFEPGDRHSVVGARFHAEHERRNGYQRPQEAIEVVTLRARAEVPSPIDVARVLAAELPAPDATTGVVVVDEGGVGVVDRDRLPRGFEATGPLLVTALDATTWVPDGFTVRVDDLGNLILQVVAADAAGDHATEGGATSDNREDLR